MAANYSAQFTDEQLAARAKESNTEWIMGVAAMVYSLAMIFIGLRLYTRLMIIKKAGWDDFFMSLTIGTQTAGIIMYGLSTRYGMGKHYENISAWQRIELSKMGFFKSLICNSGGLCLMKVSLGLSLLKLSRAKWYTWTIRGFITFVVCTTIFGWGTIIFYCDPPSGWWDKSGGAKCYSIKMFIGFALFHTANNMFTDVAFATLPIPIIWMLQMKKKLRLYLIGIMSLGWICVAMGVMKAYYQIQHGGNLDTNFMYGVQFWSFVQCCTSIIAGCIPTLKPLVGRALKLTSTVGTSGPSKYYGGGISGQGGAYGRSNRRHTGYINQDSVAARHTGHRSGVDPLDRDGHNDMELNDRPYGGGKGEGTTFQIEKKSSSPGVYSYTTSHNKGGDSGSEDMILQGTELKSGGIIRTTEISVQR